MAKNVQLTIDIKGDDSVAKASEATKSLKTQLKELKAELASGNLSGKEFDEAAERAGKLQDSIADVNQRVKNLASDTGKLDGFIDIATGITGGFAAAQGAMALFGNENEDVQKQLVKIQGAVALLNGVQQVANTLNKDSAAMTQLQAVRLKVLTATQAAYTFVVGASTGAMKVFRLALAATGVGALVVGVGLLIANFDKVKSAVMGVVDRFKNLGSGTKNLISVLFPIVGIIRLVYAGLEKLGVFAESAADRYEKLEKVTKTNMKQMQREIDLMEAQGVGARELYLAKHKLLMVEYDLMEAKRKSIGLTKEEQEAQKDLANSINILNAEETKRQSDEEEKRQDERNKANQEAAKKRKEEFNKKKEEAKKEAEELKKILAEETEAKRLRGKSAFELELMELQKEAEKKQELFKNDLEAQKLIRENFEKDAIALNEKYRLEALEKKKELDEKEKEDKKEKDEKEKERIENLANAEISATQSIQDAKLGIANQTADLLGQLAGKNKAVAIAALAVEKGAAIAGILINRQREISAYNANPAWSLLPDGGTAIKTSFKTLANIRAGIGIAQIAATTIGGAKGSSGGSGGGNGGGSVQPPNIRGSQTTNEQPTTQPTKVFVTETDIRSVTRKVDGIFTQATII